MLRGLRARTDAVRSQGGMGLLEVIVAIAITSLAVLAMLQAWSTVSVATRSVDGNVMALELMRTQLEDIKAATYNTAANYPVSVAMPSSEYTVTMQSSIQDSPANTLQLITVTVKRLQNSLLSMSVYKAKLS